MNVKVLFSDIEKFMKEASKSKPAYVTVRWEPEVAHLSYPDEFGVTTVKIFEEKSGIKPTFSRTENL